jgi:hypothetical protein
LSPIILEKSMQFFKFWKTELRVHANNTLWIFLKTMGPNENYIVFLESLALAPGLLCLSPNCTLVESPVQGIFFLKKNQFFISKFL